MPPSSQYENTTTRSGVLLGLGAFGFWGIAPIYYQFLTHVPADEIIVHRVLWSVALIGIFKLGGYGSGRVRETLRTPGQMPALFCSAALIVFNWSIFTWAVTHGQVLQTSLGYFINPLINVVLGMLFLKERLRPLQTVSVLLAATGVAQLVWQQGELPWISLALALSFGLYALVRKHTIIDGINGVFVETMFMTPFALAYGGYLMMTGTLTFAASDWSDKGLLLLAGPVTITPLALFAGAARHLRLTTLGVLQYTAPSLTFLLAVFAFHEPFDTAKLTTFVFIWVALALYTYDSLRATRAKALEPAVAESGV